MSTPQAKRRRLNEATKTLHKPFKSPFRTSLKPEPPSSDPPSSDPPDITTPAPAPLPAVSFTPLSSRVLNLSTSHSNISTPCRQFAKKTSPSLTREIIQLRSEIQILSQAHALATSTKDEDLTRLIDTWRIASRAAAEELFAGTRDRVNRMGGVAGWREREKEQKEWRKKWDKEEMDAERERRQGQEGAEENRMENDYADEACNREEEEEPVNPNDDDSFTMGMMLKTLNIDLKLIGYDKDAQRWDG